MRKKNNKMRIRCPACGEVMETRNTRPKCSNPKCGEPLIVEIKKSSDPKIVVRLRHPKK